MKDKSQNRLMVIIVVLLVFGLIGGARVLAKQNSDSHVLHSTRTSSARSDCSRKISDEQQAVRDQLDSLALDASLAGYRASVGLPGQQAIVDKLTAIGGPIDKARTKVEELKPKQQLVTKTCPAP